LSPTQHGIDVEGKDRLHKENVGFVFQLYNLLPVLTAEKNVELPLLLTKLSRAERKKRAAIALKVVGLAERASALFNSQQAHHWFATMEEEYENFRTALGWAAEKLDTDADLRLASAMCRFWFFRGNIGEGYKWVDAALARRRDASPALRARLLRALSR